METVMMLVFPMAIFWAVAYFTVRGHSLTFLSGLWWSLGFGAVGFVAAVAALYITDSDDVLKVWWVGVTLQGLGLWFLLRFKMFEKSVSKTVLTLGSYVAAFILALYFVNL